MTGRVFQELAINTARGRTQDYEDWLAEFSPQPAMLDGMKLEAKSIKHSFTGIMASMHSTTISRM